MADSNVRNGEDEVLAAQSHIWNHMFNFINSMSLKCAVELGIPDIIHNHGQPMTLLQLTQALPIEHAKSEFVYRLMRILVHSGFFVMKKIHEEFEEGYSLTPSSKLLLKDNPSTVTPLLLAMLDPILLNPWQNLSKWFQNSDITPFYTCHGVSFWEGTGRDPKLNQFFNEAMASDARLVSSVLIRDCKDVFLGLNTLVDGGGGTGALARALAEAFPHLKCTVLDLPHVVHGLKSSGNLAFVGGDIFEAIPSADAVLLKWVFHGWNDKQSVEILKKCKEAIPSKEKGGKLVILDMVVKADEQHKDKNVKEIKGTETQLFFDMLMMIVSTGKERNEKEWEKLFIEAGFTSYTITHELGLVSLIQVYY